ncbi:hypothetical protein GGP96_002665 [Salinibacter ruber]|uniref:Uncharacterized protein n=1 Tax=Salinibacter ruber TaxID=146919 RepID=A0A9X2U4C9_9BACT|nr:hypothetical protein [Salinibacter ruber]MCS3866413.1 hypothetical protein [Salinibacter ruber]MCS4151732.1 hypothetical protein [Salinibacter ruber]MCS4177925.1 hypothetical protein [Salinibacter ruber]
MENQSMDSTHDTPPPPRAEAQGINGMLHFFHLGRGHSSTTGAGRTVVSGPGWPRASGTGRTSPVSWRRWGRRHAAQPMGRDEASPSTCSSPRAPSGRSSPPRCSVARPSPEAASGAARWAVPGRGALVRMLCRETRSPGPETAPSPRPARLPQRHQSCPLQAVHSRRTTVRVALPRRTVPPMGRDGASTTRPSPQSGASVPAPE